MKPPWRESLDLGQVIPACPLPLTADGRWSERHQRAVVRYYLEAGAGGLAVGVHSTQFAIRQPQHNLLRPVLELAVETIEREAGRSPHAVSAERFVKIAGICGDTRQATAEAELAGSVGYHAGLLSLTAVGDRSEEAILEHCRAVAAVLPTVGFYLQPAVGGRAFPYRFWRRFLELDRLIAIKIAPFDRYQTLDVVRATVDAGRDDVALYTGNDDNIVVDLMTPFRFGDRERVIVGGLLGQWGVWTRRAVEMLDQIRQVRDSGRIDQGWLSRAAALTDANAAIFDAANGFAGCIPGIMEVLRRQGLAPSNRCLDPDEVLSPGQAEQLDRVCREFPELTDDEFVRTHLDRWLNRPGG